MAKHNFVGFGFGPIQGGLFLYEAFRSGNFNRLAVAEVAPQIIAALRRNHAYSVNVATPQGIETHEVAGVEVFDPQAPHDQEALIAAVADADEIATALPSVDFYDKGASVARMLALGLKRKLKADKPPAVIYAAENHNEAAEILEDCVWSKLERADAKALSKQTRFLNTVIGKMSGVVREPAEIAAGKLAPLVPGGESAFLVEVFNRILISRIDLPGFQRGLTVFEEKDDLLPFEEAKLFGHNATHALIGYLAHRRGYAFMSEAGQDQELMALARDAFLNESGQALIARHKGVDELFTPDGYRAFADDLLARMINPFLRDQISRVIRDPRRKLAWDDRFAGTMRAALEAGVTPCIYARGAAAALAVLAAEQPGQTPAQLLDELWREPDPKGLRSTLMEMVLKEVRSQKSEVRRTE